MKPFSYFSTYDFLTYNLETDFDNLRFRSKGRCTQAHKPSDIRPSCCQRGLCVVGVGRTWLAKLDLTVVGMHWLKSASLKMMAGFLPPSSSESRLQCEALLSVIRWAVSVLPVKEIRGTSGWHTRASPALAPVPNTTFTTPGGTPDGNKGTQSSDPSCRSEGVTSLCFVPEVRK